MANKFVLGGVFRTMAFPLMSATGNTTLVIEVFVSAIVMNKVWAWSETNEPESVIAALLAGYQSAVLVWFTGTAMFVELP
jgi:hypothetical protein